MHTNIKCAKKKLPKEFQRNHSRKEFIPQQHQNDTVDYLLKSKGKGLILYHELGSGKSCTSILYIDKVIDQFDQISIFSPASIRKNFIDEYCDVCGKDPSMFKDKFVFYSYNYSGIEKLLPDNLDNNIIIVDEAHNVINGKRNGSTTFSAIYDLINYAENSKVLLLTGTPFKKLIDIPLLINLVKPNAFKISYDDFGIYTGNNFIMSLMKKEFKVFDHTTELYIPKSEEVFIKKISGVISHFKRDTPSGSGPEGTSIGYSAYPQRINMPLQKIYMSKGQTSEFYDITGWENDQFKPPDSLKRRNFEKWKLDMGLWHVANKRLLSRSVSNFMYPKTVKINNKIYRFNITYDHVDPKYEIIEEPLQTLPDRIVNKGGWVHNAVFEPKKLSGLYSPKIYKLLENIANNLDGKHMIYSVLKTRGGVNLVQALSEMCGLKSLIYSGDIPSDKKRREILDAFNSIENLRGENYKMILLTEAGGEGLTLKHVKYVHILESDKNEAKIQEIKGSTISYISH